jgi:hypothetical protein
LSSLGAYIQITYNNELMTEYGKQDEIQGKILLKGELEIVHQPAQHAFLA